MEQILCQTVKRFAAGFQLDTPLFAASAVPGKSRNRDMAQLTGGTGMSDIDFTVNAHGVSQTGSDKNADDNPAAVHVSVPDLIEKGCVYVPFHKSGQPDLF